MSQSNNLQSKIELRHDYIILKRKNVGKTAFSFRHFPTFYNRHLHWTYFEKEYGHKDGRKNIKIVSDFWKNEIRDIEKEYKFSKNDITLDKNELRVSPLGLGYSLGNIISKHYEISNLKECDNDKIISDLIEMVNLLKDIKSKLVDNVDNTNKKIISGISLSNLIEEKENNLLKQKEEKKRLVLTEKNYNKKNINSEGSNRISKTDHIDVAKTKQFNGKQGELLVYNYELERIKSNKELSKYIHKVEHVSETIGDGLGYDIVSFDMINGKVEKIYIEVKTVIGNINSDINLSVKEYNIAKEKKDRYRIYKVFKYNTMIPELKIIENIEESNLYLEPSGYLLKVKSLSL